MGLDYEHILYEIDDGIALVTLNRPEKRNAMTARMGVEMADAIAERLIWEGVGIDLHEWRKREPELFAMTTKHPDARAGTVAFFEKRAPQWKGSPTRELPDDL